MTAPASRRSAALRAAVLLGVLAAPCLRAAEGPGAPLPARMLDDLVVMAGGRLKPFATLAREEVRRIFASRRYAAQHPVETYLGVLFSPADWLERKCIAPDRRARAVFAADALAPREVLDHWDSRVAALHAMQRGGESSRAAFQRERAALESLWNEIGALYTRADAIRNAASQARFLPDPNAPDGEWLTGEGARAAAARGVASLTAGIDASAALARACAERDAAAFAEAARSLKAAQRALAAEHGCAILPPAMVGCELLYYAVDFRAVGLALFAAAALAFLLAGLRECAACRLAATALYALGALWTAWIVGGHTAIAGRLPLKNLHEVFLVVLFFVPVIGIVLRAAFRDRLYLGVAALLTAVGFTGSMFLPPEGYAISPLVAILHSPWREVHILTIMLSYAILLVAFGLHAAFIIAALASPRAAGGERGCSPLAERLHRDAVLTVGWGFFFLTAGIATGAAWANSSWGRYWGWDPKEVWATVAWLIYALFLHMRIFFKPRKGVLAAVNAIGFAAILFTYFGVTYLLSGLHAYR
ncbi:MAG TPA: hypothetical protein DCM87_12135 [Planctomycetes bacterium]|nr:hypothetical protein [Planctomycetota bacterium]